MLSIRTQLLLVDQRSKVTWGVQNQRNQPKRCSGVNNIKGEKKDYYGIKEAPEAGSSP